MKVVKWVDGVFGFLVVASTVGACAPEITVSRNDEATAGAGGEDATGGTADPGGTRNTGGTAGMPNETGGTGAASAGDAGSYSGGSAAMGGDGPLGGRPPIGGDGGTGASTGDPCPCSRRVEAPINRNCPRGSGASLTTTIGPAGGDAELSGTASTVGVPFRVQVTGGSLEEDTELTLTELTQAAPVDFVDYSPLYRVAPDDLEFVNGGEVAIPWTVPSGRVPSDLAIYHSASIDGPFELLTDTYQNAGFSQATLLYSGYFFVGSPKTEELENCP
jgi:hypothetical protein